MSILKKVVSDSLVTAVRVVVTTVRGLIVIPLITNLLGAGSYGIWTTVLALTSLIKSTGSFHLHGALIRYGSQDQEQEKTYVDIIAIILVIGIALAALVTTAGYLVDLQVLLDGEVDDELGLVFAASVLIFTSMIWQINLNFPRAKGRVKLYDSLKMMKIIIESLGLVIVFLSGGGIIEGILLLAGVSLISSIGIFIFILYSYTLPRPSIQRYRTYFTYSIPMVPRIISGSLLSNGDKYLILYFLSPAAVGVYAVAYSVSTLLTKFTSVLNPTLYPTISKAWDDGKQQEISNLYKKILRGYFILAIPALAGLALLAEPLMNILSTADIAQEGAVLVPILVLGFVMKGAHNPLTYVLTASEKTGKIAVVIILGTILNISLNILAIPRFGILGAAGATAVSASVIFLLMYYYVQQEVAIPIPYKTIARGVLTAAIMTGVLIVLPISGTLAQLIIYPILGSMTYFSVLFLIGEFTSAEQRYVKENIHRFLPW